MEYNMRQLEMQCLNNKGMRVEDWYCIPIVERTWMVAGMLLPVVSAALESLQSSVNAQLESMRHR
jgi:hypothetical protein